MDIGKRIKERREALNMSQQELAIKAGYKSRSSINKIEKDGRGLPQTKIVKIAEALETTPAYLMGWLDETKKIELIHPDISSNAKLAAQVSQDSQVQRLLSYFCSFSDMNKEKIIKYAESINNIQKLDEETHLLVDAAHERTDVDSSEDMKAHDDAIMDDDSEWE